MKNIVQDVFDTVTPIGFWVSIFDKFGPRGRIAPVAAPIHCDAKWRMFWAAIPFVSLI